MFADRESGALGKLATSKVYLGDSDSFPAFAPCPVAFGKWFGRARPFGDDASIVVAATSPFGDSNSFVVPPGRKGLVADSCIIAPSPHFWPSVLDYFLKDCPSAVRCSESELRAFSGLYSAQSKQFARMPPTYPPMSLCYSVGSSRHAVGWLCGQIVPPIWPESDSFDHPSLLSLLNLGSFSAQPVTQAPNSMSTEAVRVRLP